MRLKSGSLLVLLTVFPGWNLGAAVLSQQTKPKKIIESEAGLNIPEVGIAIDAVYEKKLDNLIPGYKLLLVVVNNKTAPSILFNPKKDRWLIRDNIGHSHKGINHPKLISEKIWENLPQRLKEEFDYPPLLRQGQMARIDILFPDTVELENFRELIWKSPFFRKEFRLHVSSDSPNTESLIKIMETTPDQNKAPAMD